MTPTFLQKRRAAGHALRSGMTIFVLIFFLVAYSLAFSLVIASRDLTQADKHSFISLLLITALFAMGLLKRLLR